MKVSSLILEYMKKKGITQISLSEKVGISRAYLNAMLKARKISNVPVLKRICKILDIPDERMKRCGSEDSSNEFSMKWEETV